MSVIFSVHLTAAHEQKYHKGRATEGEVISISSQGFEIATKSGAFNVIITDETRFERCDSNASHRELTKGTKLKIYGTKLPGRKMAAKEIFLEGTHGSDERGH